MVHKNKLSTYHIVAISMIKHFQYLIPNFKKGETEKKYILFIVSQEVNVPP